MRRRPLFAIIAAILGFVTVVISASDQKLDGAENAKRAQKPAVASGESDGSKYLFSDEALKYWRQCGPGRFIVSNGLATGEGGMGLWWYLGK